MCGEDLEFTAPVTSTQLLHAFLVPEDDRIWDFIPGDSLSSGGYGFYLLHERHHKANIQLPCHVEKI